MMQLFGRYNRRACTMALVLVALLPATLAQSSAGSATQAQQAKPAQATALPAVFKDAAFVQYARFSVGGQLFDTVSGPTSANTANSATAGPTTLVSETAPPLTHLADVAAPARQAASGAPAPAPAALGSGKFRYFPQTGHYLHGIFLQFWITHGQTPVLGLPITEPIVENGLSVQYLERARLEWHPEISTDPSKQVLLTRLGAITTEQRGVQFDRAPTGNNTNLSVYFNETGHNLGNAFLTFWQNNGGLAVYGYPISEEVSEVSPTDGKTYTVQYFERNRFEWHPENPSSSNVQLGLLGNEYAHEQNIDPLARVMLPSYITKDQDLLNSAQLNSLVDAGLMPAVKLLGDTPQFKWVPALIAQNKIYVEFATIGEQGVAGAFIATYSKVRPYVIVIPDQFKDEQPEALASVLAHEATHAQDTIQGVVVARSGCSVEEELRAYLNGYAAWLLLKGEDALAGTYTKDSLADDVNLSFIGFNDNSTGVSFDFDLQFARSYLAGLYGSSCGK